MTAGLTWVVAAGYLPSLYIDATRQTPFVQYFAGAMWLLKAIAIVLLFVRRRTILDVWLIVAVFVAIPDLGLAFLYPAVRFSVGWYMAKTYILIASCTVLSVLLWETTMLYARLASAIILQRRERANRLLSVEVATAAIAHEIKQPLAAISVNNSAALNWLKRMPPDLEEARACLTASIVDSDRANEIVAGIRGLFKTTAPQRTMIEINHVVRQVLLMVEKRLACSRSNRFNRISRKPVANNGRPHPATSSDLELGQECDRSNGRWSHNEKDASAGNSPRRKFGRLTYCPRHWTRNKS